MPCKKTDLNSLSQLDKRTQWWFLYVTRKDFKRKWRVCAPVGTNFQGFVQPPLEKVHLARLKLHTYMRFPSPGWLTEPLGLLMGTAFVL